MLAGAHQIRQPLLAFAGDLRHGDAGHGLEHQRSGVPDAQQIFLQQLCVALGRAARLTDHILDELLPQPFLSSQRLRRQILQIDHLNAAFPQSSGKLIMLLLGRRQIRDIVKQQLLQRIRRKMLQLRPRALEQHLFQRTDLTFHTDRHFITPFPWQISRRGGGFAGGRPSALLFSFDIIIYNQCIVNL